MYTEKTAERVMAYLGFERIRRLVQADMRAKNLAAVALKETLTRGATPKQLCRAFDVWVEKSPQDTNIRAALKSIDLYLDGQQKRDG